MHTARQTGRYCPKSTPGKQVDDHDANGAKKSIYSDSTGFHKCIVYRVVNAFNL